MKIKLLVFCLLFSVIGWGQILTFDFSGLAGNEVSASSNSNNTNLTSSTITRGSGLTASANADRFNAIDWATGSITNAISGNDYMQFTITPNSGYQFSVSSIVFNWQRSGTGSTQIALRSSIDGYSSNLDAIKSITDNTTTQVITFSFTQSNSTTAVTYRIYGYSEASAGSAGPEGTGNDIIVNGSVSSSCVLPTISSIFPSSGPVGTEVTINASSGNLSGATATFGGQIATVLSSSTNQMVVVVPTGATSNDLVITDTQPCAINQIFTFINEDLTSCDGLTMPTQLFISEVTDSNTGALSYVEIFNATGATVNLDNYSIRTANNGGGYSNIVDLNNVNLANNTSYVIALGTGGATCSVTGGDGSLAAQSSGGGSVNFTNNEHDHIGLFNGVTLIDSWGVFGSNSWAPSGIGAHGASFKRINTATVPSTTYSNSDWAITDYVDSDCNNNDYSNIGLYNFPIAIAPIINTQPTINVSCNDIGTSLSVSATEGLSSGNSLAYQWYVVAPNTISWTALSDSGVYTGSATNTLNISNIAGLEGYQYYCQVREDDASCYTATVAVKLTSTNTVTWDGSNWSPSTPTISTPVIINGNYDTATNGVFSCCNLTVNNTYTLNIASDDYVEVENNVVNNGSLTIQDDGSLVQLNDSGTYTSSGTNTMHRNPTNLHLYDYVYWSSPQESTTFATIPNSRYYEWIPDYPNPVGYGYGNWFVPSGSNMTKGKGYIFRVPSSLNQNVTFTGSNFNNGVVSVEIKKGPYTNSISIPPGINGPITDVDDNWNLVGNPYPSAIDALEFLNDNSSMLENASVSLWRHISSISNNYDSPFYQSFVYNYNQDDYVTYNGTGSIPNNAFDGYIGAGQGFFVSMSDNELVTSPGSLVFNNSQRNKNHNNAQFFRTLNSKSNKNLEKHRIWLDLINPNNIATSQLIGYVENATNQNDFLFESRASLQTGFQFYSIIDSQLFTIQGRQLPFVESDAVPLGVIVPSDGKYTIAINSVDGRFSDTNNKIYVEDKLTNTIHDLTVSPYQFDILKGNYTNRFVLRYTDDRLSNEEFDNAINGLKLFELNNYLNIVSENLPIKEYEIYNVLGQKLAQKKNIFDNKAIENTLMKTNQTLIVKVTFENGQVESKKVIF